MRVFHKTLTLPGGGEWLWLLGTSDWHLGARLCDERRIRRDLDEARERSARILIPGDVYDLILPRDARRYQPSAVAEWLVGRDHQIDCVVSRAFDLLSPYADLVDFVGLGNHETAIIKRYATDPVGLLVHRLNVHLERKGSKHRIEHGGISGYVVYSLRSKGSRGGIQYRVLYHHGAGGDSPVTKGVIDVNRKSANWVYDLYMAGHKHNRWAVADQQISPGVRSGIDIREPRNMQCGSYLKNWDVQGGETATEFGYAEASNHAPKPLGGTFVKFRVVNKQIDQRVEL